MEDDRTTGNPIAASSSGFTSTIRTFCFHLFVFFNWSSDQETIPPLTESSIPPSPAMHREMEAKMYPESCSVSLQLPPSTPPLQEPAPPCPDRSETTTPKLTKKSSSKVLSLGLPSDPKDFHPVFILLREEQLGRHILVLAIPMIVGLFSCYNRMKDNPLILRFTALSLSYGVTWIWNGILLRRTFNRFSLVLELLGVAAMLSAFFSFVAWFLPLIIYFIPVVCWVLCLLPFAIAFCSEEASENEKDSDCCLAV
ncbi:hypothetical protein SLA2020_417820 [Shorea laevis]